MKKMLLISITVLLVVSCSRYDYQEMEKKRVEISQDIIYLMKTNIKYSGSILPDFNQNKQYISSLNNEYNQILIQKYNNLKGIEITKKPNIPLSLVANVDFNWWGKEVGNLNINVYIDLYFADVKQFTINEKSVYLKNFHYFGSEQNAQLLDHIQGLFNDVINEKIFNENQLIDQIDMYKSLGYLDIQKLQNELDKIQKEIDQKVGKKELQKELRITLNEFKAELRPVLDDIIYYNSRELVRIENILDLLINLTDKVNNSNFDYIFPLIPNEIYRIVIKVDNSFEPGRYNIFTDARIVKNTFVERIDKFDEIDLVFQGKLSGKDIRLLNCVNNSNIDVNRFTDVIIKKSQTHNGLFAQ